MNSHACPNCGASVRVDGVNDAVRCTFCGTHVAVPRVFRGASRRELDAEREQILARERELDASIKQTEGRGLEDYLVPPIGCCGVYFALFVIGSLSLSAIGAEAAKRYGTAVAAISIISALIAVVLIIWRREARRRERALTLERERIADRHLREERLREIEAELTTLDD